MQLATANGFVTIATSSQYGTSNTKHGRFRRSGSRASLNCVFAAMNRAMSFNFIVKSECAHQLAGMHRALTANVRVWEKITALAILVAGGTRSMRRLRFLGAYRNMLVVWFARGLLLNMSIDTGAQGHLNVGPNNDAEGDQGRRTDSGCIVLRRIVEHGRVARLPPAAARVSRQCKASPDRSRHLSEQK